MLKVIFQVIGLTLLIKFNEYLTDGYYIAAMTFIWLSFCVSNKKKPRALTYVNQGEYMFRVVFYMGCLYYLLNYALVEAWPYAEFFNSIALLVFTISLAYSLVKGLIIAIALEREKL